MFKDIDRHSVESKQTPMKKSILFTALGAVVFLLSAFVLFSDPKNNGAEKQAYKELSNTEEFNEYWYAGKAEINTYKLKQARYGDYHEGIVESIFVTEPFLSEKQVKADNYNDERDITQVLKHNFLKKFGTGIYPYSMMLSTFTPINQEQGLIKSTFSSQDWCGQSYGQMNLKKNQYNSILHSYFEREGDQESKFPFALTEDEIWTRIRIDYKSLPQGEIDILPGFYHSRLTHKELEIEKANASLSKQGANTIYTVEFPEQKRTLAIEFTTAFPHRILGWTESSPNRRTGSSQTTEAVLDQSIYIDYWNYNSNKHKNYRDSLNLLY